MKKLISLITLIVLGSTINLSAKNIMTDIPNEGVFEFGNNKGYIKLPDNYSNSEKYPLIIFFSGRGGSADNNNLTSVEFATFRKKAAERGYVIAVPGYGSDCWFNEDAEKITLEMIDFVSQKVSVDTTRFYIMGCSMGGASALIFTARHPEKVKAVCDIFGVTDFIRFYKEGFYNASISKAYGGTPDKYRQYYRDRSAINLIEKYKGIPFMIIHGDKDSCVPKWNSDILVDKMKECGIKIEYMTVKNVGHENRIINGLENKVLDFFDSFKKIKN